MKKFTLLVKIKRSDLKQIQFPYLNNKKPMKHTIIFVKILPKVVFILNKKKNKNKNNMNIVTILAIIKMCNIRNI